MLAVVAACLLIVVALGALIASEFAPWPIDKLAPPVLLAFSLAGGFALRGWWVK